MTVLVYKHVTDGHWHQKTVHTEDDLDEVRESDFVKEVIIVSVKGKLVISNEDGKRVLTEMEQSVKDCREGLMKDREAGKEEANDDQLKQIESVEDIVKTLQGPEGNE
jgi:hypothetical protein